MNLVMTKLLPIGLQNAFLASRIFLKKFPKVNSGSRLGESLDIRRGKKFCAFDDENIVCSPLGDAKIPEVLFHDLIFQNWDVWERRTAIICGHTGRKYTFGKLRNYSKALAGWMQSQLKLVKGDVVAVVLPNTPEYPIIFLAASQAGCALTTVNPIYTPFEIQSQFVQVSPKVIFTSTNVYEKCVTVLLEMRSDLPIILVKSEKNDKIPTGAIDLLELFDERFASAYKPADVTQKDTLVLPFSSGTTGPPKGVVLTHKNLVSNLSQLSHPDTTILISPTWFRQFSVLGVLPMCHIFGMMVMTFFTLKEGCRLIVLPTFSPREFVINLYRKKINILYVVPPVITFLTHKAIKSRYLKHLRYIVNGASRYFERDVTAILEKAPHVKVAQGYGMTEASPVLTHTSASRMQKLNTVGIPIAGTSLKVVDIETGLSLPQRKTGELCAYGPQVMQGYYKNPDDTKNAFDKSGWLRTGDLAYYDEDGDFYIIERLKDLIKVSGYQVAPAEVEETLRIHPKIRDAVVVGVPHEKYGEVPKAFIIPESQDLTAEEVQKFISNKLAHYKQLRGGVVFVENFPKTNAGKIIRADLKKMT